MHAFRFIVICAVLSKFCFLSFLQLASPSIIRFSFSSDSTESQDISPAANDSLTDTLQSKSKGFGKSKPQSKLRPDKKRSRNSIGFSDDDEKDISNAARDALNEKISQNAKDDIERMEREQKQRLEKQAQRIADIKAAQLITKDNPNAGIIPDAVANRMLFRMIPFFMLPVATGIGVFVLFFVLAKRYDMSFQPSTVAFSTQAPFAISLMGITYAILSSSWDPEREGSKLGFDEFKTNIGSMVEGLRRSSERQELDDAIQKDKRRKN